MFYLGLKASLYGMSGVFLVLILFFFVTKGMLACFEKMENKSSENIQPKPSNKA